VRYLTLALSALADLARALVPAGRRRRAHRARRYAQPGPALPTVATGPIPIVRPARPLRRELADAIDRRRAVLGIAGPDHPRLPGRHRPAHQAPEERPLLLTPAARRVRADESRAGMIRLIAIAHHAQEQQGAAA
jgi:hypothetical protein